MNISVHVNVRIDVIIRAKLKIEGEEKESQKSWQERRHMNFILVKHFLVVAADRIGAEYRCGSDTSLTKPYAMASLAHLFVILSFASLNKRGPHPGSSNQRDVHHLEA